jgi:glyoxylase-like metal-dependent hydrolase (beta-lactamase superfamily II)/rhodanese-related sulfurtransferase
MGGLKMSVSSFSAMEMFDWLCDADKIDFLLLDVRNEEEFGRFKIEGPFDFEMLNVPYMEFIEHEKESVARVPKRDKIRVVCAKEGSSKYVADILDTHGYSDLANLQVGIKAWGNLLAPIKVAETDTYGLYQFRRPGKASCSYGLTSGKEMMVFDPAKNIAAYQTFADERGLAIIKTIETHRQADYISGSPALNKTVSAEIIAPTGDFEEAKFKYTPAADGELIAFSQAGPEVRIVHTPGHTPGSTSYLIDNQYLITGDTVFIFSIGRPDLGGMAEAWSKMLFDTVQKKILTLDDETIILPGHYMDWKEANDDLIFAEAIGRIKEINKEIYSINNETDFYQYIKSNMRKQPEEYAKIRQINAGLIVVDPEEQDIMDLGKNECAASAMVQG